MLPLARDAAPSQAWGVQLPLFLTGMMGCGKTTVGRILADEYGIPMVDLDTRIERLFGVSIAELFEAGESEFRRCERIALHSLFAEPGFGLRPVVVSTGGGTLLDPDNRAAIDDRGTRVYLEVSVDELVRRLWADESDHQGTRPLLVGDRPRLRSRVVELLSTRRSVYRSAPLCIDANTQPASVALRIIVALGGEAETLGSEAV